MSELTNNANPTPLERAQSAVKSFGLPRLIIAGMLVVLRVAAPIVGANFWMQITNVKIGRAHV